MRKKSEKLKKLWSEAVRYHNSVVEECVRLDALEDESFVHVSKTLSDYLAAKKEEEKDV